MLKEPRAPRLVTVVRPRPEVGVRRASDDTKDASFDRPEAIELSEDNQMIRRKNVVRDPKLSKHSFGRVREWRLIITHESSIEVESCHMVLWR